MDHIDPYRIAKVKHPLSLLDFQSNEIIYIFPILLLSSIENAYTYYMDSPSLPL